MRVGLEGRLDSDGQAAELRGPASGRQAPPCARGGW